MIRENLDDLKLDDLMSKNPSKRKISELALQHVASVLSPDPIPLSQ